MLTKLDDGMAQFRLCFAHTISNDPVYTFEQDAEEVMWRLHIFVNQAYRDLIYVTLKGQQHVVTRRKVEKLYNTYLKTALLFYKGYFQRLEALHGMPQIPRINRLLNLETLSTAETKGVSIPAEAVEKSFHAILLHLGDISRWKNKARPRPDGWKTAGLYYELANDLKPTDGAAHHQLGILEDDNHLQIVYHLYRARAIEVPHPNAITNLEQEFKKLLQPAAPGKRSGAPDPNEAFPNWFTRLHARLYKGDEFPPELEAEVMHHLNNTLRKPDALPLVLKMVLVNIAAYWVAKSKIEKEWSLKASASCEFILRLNVRWILVIFRLLQSELEEFVKAAPPTEKSTHVRDAQGSHVSSGFSVFTEIALPLARIYTAWLYIYRVDIVNYQQHLGKYVFDMYRSVAQTLTTVARQFTGTSMTPSPYLLVEDIMALGMKPFDDPSLPAMCRLQHDAEKGNFKPHLEDSGRSKNSPEEEMLSRIYDLMGCGLSLGFDEQFPLRIATSAAGGPTNMITISYVEGDQAPVPFDTLAGNVRPVGQISKQKAFTSVQDLQMQESVCKGEEAGRQEGIIQGSDDLSHKQDATNSGTRLINQLTPPEYPITDDSEGEGEVDLNLDARMMTMVDDLLGDDEDMGFGGQSDQAKRLESLLAMQSTSPNVSLRDSRQQQSQGTASTLDNNAPSPWNDAYGDTSRSVSYQQSAAGNLQDDSIGRPRMSSLQPSVAAFIPGSRPHSGSDNQQLGTSRGALGSTRPSSGVSSSACGNLGHARQKFGGSADSIAVLPMLSPKSSLRAQQPQVGRQSISQQSVTTSPPPGFEFGKSPFSTAFSHNASSLPTLHSPLGMATANIDGAYGRREYPSNHQTYSAHLRNHDQYQQYNAYGAANNDNINMASVPYGRGSVCYPEGPFAGTGTQPHR
ncbi:hypothetical protein BD289DRAFT_131449 [Coniella lustricola]|uniref:Nonsense-mediated mRNA decay factor n=1 Tax=Coniella lustricola TaxID=2025994 RepID=A0A2T3AFP2_9PEZI|nr:hypothetical protein BD289DRAFT_131449 [Coniella lustricola]